MAFEREAEQCAFEEGGKKCKVRATIGDMRRRMVSIKSFRDEQG